jgi:hypothetical protein
MATTTPTSGVISLSPAVAANTISAPPIKPPAEDGINSIYSLLQCWIQAQCTWLGMAQALPATLEA